MVDPETRQFEALLELLKQNRGFDFTGYKRSTLMRRMRKRMQTVGINDYTEYSDYLEVHPDEFRELFNTVLINVTAFLRDAEAWQSLNEHVIPALAGRSGQIRVWTTGCASGEETYTLIMMLAEAIGIDRFKAQVKIYATDADADALTIARHAVYPAEALEPLPAEWREKYFDANGSSFVFRPDLRRSVVFGEHDLVQDAPISRLDLLVCRNTLIYFNAETQARIIERMHFALKDSGYLFLGKSEALLTHSRLFLPLDVRARIFVKVARANLRDRLLELAQTGNEETEGAVDQQVSLRESSFDAGPVAQVVVDRDGAVVLANEQARKLFRLNAKDVGKPIQDLELSYRPIELRSRIQEAHETQQIVIERDVEYALGPGDKHHFNVQVAPLVDHGHEHLGTSITFSDVTAYHHLRGELERSSHELESAYEELQATNEELETTNEELQSTIEELETTNEELQSTNEELETMNEELQSTNEELETINDELRRRTHEVKHLNDFLETIMSSIKTGVAVTDRDLHVTLWNSKAEDLWGLRREEVEGKSFLGLDIGLPVEQLAKTVKGCIAGDGNLSENYIDAINRRGKQISCRVTCTRLVDGSNEDVRGLIIFMEEWQANAKS